MEKCSRSTWKLAHGRNIDIGYQSLIMAIVNVTPDSFSDGGKNLVREKAISYSISCLKEGADIIDIGGESTRPDAIPVSAKEEQKRIIPVIEELASRTNAIISVDTYKPETAELAIKAGAHIVNDVCGLQNDINMAKRIAKYNAGVCIMHTGRNRTKIVDVFEDQFYFLNHSLEIASRSGISREQIVIDPGFGFAKKTNESFALIEGFSKLKNLDFPILVGISRKKLLGEITHSNKPLNLDDSTATVNCLLRKAGAHIFRVHNVKINRDALRIVDNVMKTQS
ncbi:dihydropteroate synthase [Candidatus Liberibacter africanus]|uniref:Dihydropteroate synthase n=1 Tax=Candidatus Liberibacter africanus PTSAPSY TaxID=1277257 RepID=A0A0G3I5T6_LIBAF|nr:dihydropteroate synthase [Candidatus Liberibacter africanus]AKK20630.1 dihydropteroate synthase [Candidatus Liberibacter africanus PTSAPSY]QTP64312.1 dihydropteroate synthase [Candidatus Liberibacter africanus]